ncbi:hypothetical protein AB1Y20_005331 [Prymnesium parvum]|uniref:TLC domain-containing protein n=1 Tax=Prymnesium parvum TaxID=97485 RepID=A0AB34J3H6_PRYPA
MLPWREAAEQSYAAFFALVAAYVVLNLALRATIGTVRPRRASEIAKSGNSSSCLADLVSYNLIASGYALSSSYIGCTAWFGGGAAAIGGTVQERMYSYLPPMGILSICTTAFELFNVVICIVLPEYRTAPFVGHHLVTFILATMSFHPWLHYYAVFFFGVASVSSVPLCGSDIFNALGFPTVKLGCDVLFAVSFFAIRTVYWPIVSYSFWSDSITMLTGGGGEVHSPASYYFLLLANIGLTSLQILWTKQIFQGVKEVLGGGASKSE